MNNTTNLVFSDAQQAKHREAQLRMEALERRMLLTALGADESDATTGQLWSAVSLKHGVKVADGITKKARRVAFR